MSKSKITEEEVNQMGKLQQLFHNRYLTPQFLHQLISIYVKAIELFNQDFKFMRTYFMDKMQFVLSRPQIINLLEGGGEAVDNIRETIRMTQRVMPVEQPKGSQPSSLIRKQDQTTSKNNATEEKPKKSDDRFQNYKPQNHVHKHVHEQHHHYHYDQSKLGQKNLKIDMKMKIMREVQQNMKNMKKQVYEAEEIFTKNQQKVKDITKNQQELLNERLMKRKKKLRKKSVQIKPQVAKVDGQEHDEVPVPAIKKQQLIQAQRQLTHAVNKFTVRMTERTRQKQIEQGNKIKGRVKKIKDLDDDEILIQQNEDQQREEQKKIDMKKNKAQQPQKAEQKIQGRVKTIRRHDDSDDD